MRVLAVIAARMGSSRLPGKALMPLAGRPMLERLIERARLSGRVSDVVVATTELEADDELEALAGNLGVCCFRGSEDDVLGRIDAAIDTVACDAVVQLLGDNPLVDPRLIADVLDAYVATGAGWMVTATDELPRVPDEMPRFPIGVRVEVFSPAAHRLCAERAGDAHSREHSSSFAHKNPGVFDLDYFAADGPWAAVSRPGYTFAINYRQNYEMVQVIFDRLYPVASDFSLADAIGLVEADPELMGGMGPPMVAS